MYYFSVVFRGFPWFFLFARLVAFCHTWVLFLLSFLITTSMTPVHRRRHQRLKRHRVRLRSQREDEEEPSWWEAPLEMADRIWQDPRGFLRSTWAEWDLQPQQAKRDHPDGAQEREVPPTTRRRCAGRRWTTQEGEPEAGSWVFFDFVFAPTLNFVGWVFFGDYWGGVRAIGARATALVCIMVVSAGIRYMACALGPVFGLMSCVVHSVLWIIRWMATWGSRRVVKSDDKKGRRALDLVGPAVTRYPETALLRSLKTATGEDPPRAVLCIGDEVLLVETDPGTSSAINRFGVELGVGRVVRSTSRRTTRQVQRAPKVHLCRAEPCSVEGELHSCCFGHLGPKEDIDVYEVTDRQAHMWAMGRIAACLYHAVVGLPLRMLRCCCCCCCRGALWRRGGAGLAQAARRKSAESETETEDERDGCEAANVGWEAEDGPRRLASAGGCKTPAVRHQKLLQGDMRVECRGEEAHLCSAHWAEYLAARWSRKCPHAGCLHVGGEEVDGVHLCPSHAAARRVAREDVRDREEQRQSSRSSDRRGSQGPRRRRRRYEEEAPEEAAAEETHERLDLGRRRAEKAPAESRRWTPRDRQATPPRESTKELLGRLAGLPDFVTPEAPGGESPEEVLRRYLEIRSSLLDLSDEEAQDLMADDMDLTKGTIQQRLIEGARRARAEGQRGLSTLLAQWNRTPPEASPARDGRDSSASSWQVLGSREGTPQGPPPPLTPKQQRYVPQVPRMPAAPASAAQQPPGPHACPMPASSASCPASCFVTACTTCFVTAGEAQGGRGCGYIRMRSTMKSITMLDPANGCPGTANGWHGIFSNVCGVHKP